ncbi:divergent polysaccharide deacetylase family protein [Providencia rustigianii]|uniref:divergent polysaccharide deacetylase family protein n=1 Tax=Providencia rustigianii TaxID=158850 RepID=UPI000F6B31D2|nr:divergent polysaccharide deacetylase family protein [Providencia rustigianii]MTC59516.1 divergent polysaccharide deacetylase family protein [Providencia rustigianii]VEH57142.1 Divergent polysaccharide deacetylase [Providencia rustigianii]
MLKCSPIKFLTSLLLIVICSQASAAKLAIVIDDFGYRAKEDNQILAMPAAISIAILPNSPHGIEVATQAYQQGRDILIHMPMKPLSKQPLEKDTLTPSMSSEEVDRIIKNAISRVPHAKGMNNHMGSEMTSSLSGMRNVMRSLSQSNLFFLDSVTIGNTQAQNAAKEFGVPSTKRNIFIDNHQSEEETRAQLNKAISYARKHGSAVAIGHPHPSTVRALQKFIPLIPADVELVPVSTLVNNQPTTTEPRKPLRMQPEGMKPAKPESQTPVQLDTKPVEPIKPTEPAISEPTAPESGINQPEQPVEIGVCDIEVPQTRLQGIEFLMSVVEAIYQDKTLQPLLSEKKSS